MLIMCSPAGIAHRDLKLENILCEYTDRVSDFNFPDALRRAEVVPGGAECNGVIMLLLHLPTA